MRARIPRFRRNPASKATSVIRLRSEVFMSNAALSSRTRRTWLFSVSPVTA
jgi:hypothetical protein